MITYWQAPFRKSYMTLWSYDEHEVTWQQENIIFYGHYTWQGGDFREDVQNPNT